MLRGAAKIGLQPPDELPSIPPPSAETCRCLRRQPPAAQRLLNIFCCCSCCCVPLFGELFDYIVRRPTHALTFPEKDWREDDEEKLNRRCCCISFVSFYRFWVNNLFLPVFRYLLLNKLFEVLAEGSEDGIKNIQDTYTFLGLVEALLLSMIITPVSSFDSFLKMPDPSDSFKNGVAQLAIYAVTLAMGISFLNLIIIMVLCELACSTSARATLLSLPPPRTSPARKHNRRLPQRRAPRPPAE